MMAPSPTWQSWPTWLLAMKRQPLPMRGDAAAPDGAGVDRDVLAEGVPVADLERRSAPRGT